MKRALVWAGISACVVVAVLSAQAPEANLVLYSAIGPELSTYSVNVDRGTLLKTSRVALPFAVQYVWRIRRDGFCTSPGATACRAIVMA